MSIITLLAMTYILLGLIYGYVAVSRLSGQIAVIVDTKRDLILGMLFLLMVSLAIWPLLLSDDIRNYKQ